MGPAGNHGPDTSVSINANIADVMIMSFRLVSKFYQWVRPFQLGKQFSITAIA
jgi:hypothetical protein